MNQFLNYNKKSILSNDEFGEGKQTWFSPLMEVRIQAPSPWIQLTLRPPIKLQTPIYGNMDLCPYLGATHAAKTTEDTIATDPHERKPGARNNFLKSTIFVTLCSSGAFKARMEAPRIHWIDPIQPKSESFSLRIRWDKMADITTDNAPMGVYPEVRFSRHRFGKTRDRRTTTMASTNA